MRSRFYKTLNSDFHWITVILYTHFGVSSFFFVKRISRYLQDFVWFYLDVPHLRAVPKCERHFFCVFRSLSGTESLFEETIMQSNLKSNFYIDFTAIINLNQL